MLVCIYTRKRAVESGIRVPRHVVRGKYALHCYAATTVAEHVFKEVLSIHTIASSLCYMHSDAVCGRHQTDAYQTAGKAEFGVIQNSLQHQCILGKTGTLFLKTCEAAQEITGQTCSACGDE